MKQKFFHLILLFSLSLTNCSVNKVDINNYLNNFEDKKKDFDELIIGLLNNESIVGKVGHTINENELSKPIKDKLDKLGIINVERSYSKCPDTTEINLTTNWTTKATVYFTKDICDKEQSAKGYHAKTSQMIEVWGLGDGWIMWIDYDFI
jgi:hypothetical protein